MSKFFIILVEDLGDENARFFKDANRFFANTKIELPTDCELRGCTEVSGDEVTKLLGETA
jgi:hypothetical protein